MLRSSPPSPKLRRASFTLIELLVVIAIIAILSVVVILVLNPAELLKQARDSNRLQDLANINTALNFFQADTGGNISLGTASTTYVSIPDPVATSTLGDQCQGLGLPSLPTGWSYHCAASSTYRLVNGTGWLPVDFTQISFKSPLALLPVDPVNQTSSRNYYTYTPGGSWELATPFESQKYKLGGDKDKASTDGGPYPDLYELGTNLTLLSVDYGDPSLVGYWNFEEGTGSVTSTDRSGMGNNGTWHGTGTHYATGKVGGFAGQFNGSSGYDYVDAGNGASVNFGTGDFTVTAWAQYTSTSLGPIGIVGKRTNDTNGTDGFDTFLSPSNDIGGLYGRFKDVNHAFNDQGSAGGHPSKDLNWHFYSWTFQRSSNLTLYQDGAQVPATASQGLGDMTGQSGSINTSFSLKIGWVEGAFSGLIDDVRVYNRALSAAEIAAMYNATR
jgi:prepilin-type N-terminal cleavage/methylation domain-containing protein